MLGVDVVIPAHNAERFLAAAIESVLGQTYPAARIIVVDDGSTDRTRQVAAGYATVEVIGQANEGPGAARNTGIAAGCNPAIAFLDADDRWRPHKLEVQVRRFREHPKEAILFGRHCLELEGDAAVPEYLQAAAARAGQDVSPLPSSWLVRRSVFEDVGLFDPAFRIGEDLDWLIRAREAGYEPAVVDEVVVDRRIHGANLSIDLGESRSAMFTVLRRALARRRSGSV